MEACGGGLAVRAQGPHCLIVNLILLRGLVTAEGAPSPAQIAQATRAVFDARAAAARTLGRPPRLWPATAVAHPHWPDHYARAAAGGGVTLPLDDAVSVVNTWLAELAAAEQRAHADALPRAV